MRSEPDCDWCSSNSTASAGTEDVADEPASYIQNEQPRQEIYVPPAKVEPPADKFGEQPSSKAMPSSKQDTDLQDSDDHRLELLVDHALNNKTQENWSDSHINSVESQSVVQNKTMSFTSSISLVTKAINITETTVHSSTPLVPAATQRPQTEPHHVPLTSISATPRTTDQIPTSRERTPPPAIITTTISSSKVTKSANGSSGTSVTPQVHLSTSPGSSTTTQTSVKMEDKSMSSSSSKPSSISVKEPQVKLNVTTVQRATKNITPTSASPSIYINSTVSNQTIKPVDMRQYPSSTLHASPQSSPNKALYAVPVVIGMVIILGLSVVVVIFYTRRRARHDNSKEWLKSIFEAKDELLQEGSDVYAQVDLAKKSKKHNNVPLQEVIPLAIVITENDPEEESTLPVTHTPSPPSPTAANSPTDAIDNTSEVTHNANVLVDNVLYEKPASLDGDSDDEVHSTLVSPLPSVSAASAVITSPPMMQTLSVGHEGSRYTSHMPPTAEYLLPSCHQHIPQGPNWQPFHDYDPVYVPTSNASAMNRRVDSTGYVRARPHSPGIPQVYEEINYGAISAPPLKPRMTMGATASGGRSARAPPPRPPSEGVSDGLYATSSAQHAAAGSASAAGDTPPVPRRTYTSIYTSNTMPFGAVSSQAGLSEQSVPYTGSDSNSHGACAVGALNLGECDGGAQMNGVLQTSGAQLSTRISAASSTESKDEPQYEVVDLLDQDDT